jgi:SAM-dependent methyltransferase
MIIDMLETIVLLLIIISVYGFVRGSSSLAPWVPTKAKDYQRINNLLIKSNPQRFIDLGCGSAGLLVYLAKNNPQVDFVGVEIALPLFLFAWLRVKLNGLKNITILYKDLFTVNLSNFDLIFVYGYPRSIKNRLAQKIKTEVKSKTVLLSQAFKFHDFKLTEVDKPNSNHLPIFIYYF